MLKTLSNRLKNNCQTVFSGHKTCNKDEAIDYQNKLETFQVYIILFLGFVSVKKAKEVPDTKIMRELFTLECCMHAVF